MSPVQSLFPKLTTWIRTPWGRRGVLATATVLGIWALAWALVPWLIHSQLEARASEALGRSVSVGAVHFRPWSLELTVEDLRVAGAQQQPPSLRIARLYMDMELQSLLRLAPVVDALQIVGVQARLTHLGQGRYDIDDILARLLDPAKPDTPLPGFALYNVAVRSLDLDFVDQPTQQTHEIRDLRLTLPFLSNLASQRQVLSEPHLSFQLNGIAFDSSAQTTPFAASAKTDARLAFTGLDIRPYLPYWPQVLPVRLQAGRLDADLRLHFEQAPRPAVRLQGGLGAQGLQISDAQGQPLFSLEALRLEVADLRPLEQQLRLASLNLSGAQLYLRRDAAGALNLAALARPARPSPSAPPLARPLPPALPPARPSAPPTHPPMATTGGWQLALDHFSLSEGQVHWADQAVQPAARMAVHALALDAQGLRWPAQAPAAFEGRLQLQPQGGRTGSAVAQLQFKGQASAQEAQVSAQLQGLALSLAAPYLASYLEPVLGGQLDADLALQWNAPVSGDPLAGLQVRLPSLVLSQFTLGARQAVAPRWPVQLERLQLQEVAWWPSSQQLTLGQLRLQRPTVAVVRDRQGRWMFESWLKSGATTAGALESSAPAKPAQASAPAWKISLKDASLVGGQVSFDDQVGSRPVRLALSKLNLQVSGLSTEGRQGAPLRLSTQVRAPQGDPGQLDFQGRLTPAPLGLQGQLQSNGLPLQALTPYLDDVLNLRVLRADAGFRGQFRWTSLAAGPSIQVDGDAVLEDVNAVTVPSMDAATSAASTPLPEELFNWKALSLRGLQVSLAPGQATRVAVAETALSDFFARILIDERGRINLQNLRKTVATSDGAGPVTPPASGPAAVAGTPAAPAEIEMGPVSLVNGRVRFSDRFIKPNYSADLSALTGRLSAFSSRPGTAGEPPAMADLTLMGRAEGTAPLEIRGKLNPLAQPLALDITGQVRDLELPPLSAYSVKYAGHGIERGKLSMDVAYRVQPDGQLVASNKLVLNQLAFGDPVEGAPNSLPVRLAVALLADRNGVIDINLPISGSLNDPEFRLGPIIWKVVVNLVVKAVTSPFALLASVFGGGGEEFASVPFAAGSSELSPQARSNLDKVAQAMVERSNLRLTVAGLASLEAEREGWRRAQLSAQLQAEKRRAAVVAGAAADAVTPYTEAERATLVQAVYRRAQIAKPRNLLGLAKSLPTAEMEALLLASLPATADQMRDLALARSVAVKDYLAARGLPLERLFLGATKVTPAEAAGPPRAELTLSLP